ncbi:MAG: Rieske (2Fe-2S) protein [Gemmatimonadota bacterium]
MSTPQGGCVSCPASDAVRRRDFLRDLVTGAVVAAGMVGVGPLPAAALPVSFGAGSGTRDDKTYALPAADGVVIDKDESVIIARFQNRAYAFSLACPHQNTALRWEAKAGRFQCPKHKSRYQPDGVFIDGRATRGLDRLAVRRDGERLLVNLDAAYEEDKHAEWKSAFVQL